MEISALSVKVLDTPLLHSIHLRVAPGSVHVLMGPNGSGKSSLALSLMGHKNYQITAGTITINGIDITQLSPDKRAKAGLFLAFQQPNIIPGVTVMQFLHEAYRALRDQKSTIGDFYAQLIDAMDLLAIDYAFAERHVNDGFSGGQKKKLELLQLLLLQPKVAILDEIDSGLDVDALKIVAGGIAQARAERPEMALLIITHYQRILNYITPDYVHVMVDGKLVRSGDASLAALIEREGYDAIR